MLNESKYKEKDFQNNEITISQIISQKNVSSSKYNENNSNKKILFESANKVNNNSSNIKLNNNCINKIDKMKCVVY